MLEKHLWNSFSLYLLVEILQLAHEISSFSEAHYKRDVLKNFLKFTDKLKKQSSGGVLSKDVLKNFAKFTEKHLCGNLFFNKVAGRKPKTARNSQEMFSEKWYYFETILVLLNLFKNRLQHRCFPVNFVNYSRTSILKSTYERLVLKHRYGSFSLIKLQAWQHGGLYQY